MSTDQPLQSEPHREYQSDQKHTSDRDRSFPGDIVRLHGHQLVAIDEWLAGAEPSPYDIDLTDSYEYRTRYWRCRKCGQERNHRNEFSTPCDEPQPPTALEAGGYSIDEANSLAHTRRILFAITQINSRRVSVRFTT